MAFAFASDCFKALPALIFAITVPIAATNPVIAAIIAVIAVIICTGLGVGIGFPYGTGVLATSASNLVTAASRSAVEMSPGAAISALSS